MVISRYCVFRADTVYCATHGQTIWYDRENEHDTDSEIATNSVNLSHHVQRASNVDEAFIAAILWLVDETRHR